MFVGRYATHPSFDWEAPLAGVFPLWSAGIRRQAPQSGEASSSPHALGSGSMSSCFMV